MVLILLVALNVFCIRRGCTSPGGLISIDGICFSKHILHPPFLYLFLKLLGVSSLVFAKCKTTGLVVRRLPFTTSILFYSNICIKDLRCMKVSSFF